MEILGLCQRLTKFTPRAHRVLERIPILHLSVWLSIAGHARCGLGPVLLSRPQTICQQLTENATLSSFDRVIQTLVIYFIIFVNSLQMIIT